MKKVDFFTPIVLVLLVYDLEAKVFTKCGLTKELLNNGFERSYVGNCKFTFVSCNFSELRCLIIALLLFSCHSLMH